MRVRQQQWEQAQREILALSGELKRRPEPMGRSASQERKVWRTGGRAPLAKQQEDECNVEDDEEQDQQCSQLIGQHQELLDTHLQMALALMGKMASAE